MDFPSPDKRTPAAVLLLRRSVFTDERSGQAWTIGRGCTPLYESHHRWPYLARGQTMLRITKQKTQQSFAVSSGGRQARDWVQELVTIMGELGPWIRTVIDMEHVHYVDAFGEKALHWLNRIGARFIARNTYCVGLCDRLELYRLTVADGEPPKYKGRNDELAPSARFGAPGQLSPKAKGRH